MKRALECDQCGSFPERAGLFTSEHEPGSRCPAGYLDDYDCDGTLIVKNSHCPVCLRGVPARRMTAHHLKTRKRDPHNTQLMCRECHSYIHKLWTNRELRDDESLHTVGGLLAHPEYRRAVEWIKTQDPNKHPKIMGATRKTWGRRR